jgi:L-gulonate 3-dehydrogenase
VLDSVHQRQTGGPFPWTGDVLDKVEAARRDKLPMDDHPRRQAWRDRRLVALIAHKRAQAEAEAAGSEPS